MERKKIRRYDKVEPNRRHRLLDGIPLDVSMQKEYRSHDMAHDFLFIARNEFDAVSPSDIDKAQKAIDKIGPVYPRRVEDITDEEITQAIRNYEVDHISFPWTKEDMRQMISSDIAFEGYEAEEDLPKDLKVEDLEKMIAKEKTRWKSDE